MERRRVASCRWRDTQRIPRRRILGCERNAIIPSSPGLGVHEYQRSFDLYNVELLFRNRDIDKGPRYFGPSISERFIRASDAAHAYSISRNNLSIVAIVTFPSTTRDNVNSTNRQDRDLQCSANQKRLIIIAARLCSTLIKRLDLND